MDIDERLKQDCFEICDLPLSKLLLMNNKLFPWYILVPKRNNVREIIDLCLEDRIFLMDEIPTISHVMKKIFAPYKINIASLGNIVEQLHIHIIARYKNDSCWPKPVFGQNKEEYDQDTADKIRKKTIDNLVLDV